MWLLAFSTPYITLKLVDNGSHFNQDVCSEVAVSFVTNKMGRFCGHCKEGLGVNANMQGPFYIS